MKTLHTIYTSFAKRTAIILTLLLTLGVTSAWGANVTFQRITSTSELTSGAKYLIVYESGKLIFNGSSVATGATGETTTVTISNNTITCDEAYAFTITSSSSSWKITGSNSKSIGHTGSSNSLTTGSYTNTISFSSNNVVIGCNSRTLRCNPNNGSPLFRYYTNGQQAIQLYKQTAPSTFTVTCQSNNASYGAVSQSSITNVANNTAILANGNTLTVGSTKITATPNEQDANYTYAFSNWSGIPAGGKVTADVTVTANFTRTARDLTNYRTTCTEPSTFTVTYSENGATSGNVPTDANSPYEKDAQVTVLGNTGNLAKTGYTFSGWNTEANGTGTPYTAGATFTITENTTLFAQWEAIPTYTVTFDSDGGSAVTTQTIEEEKTATKPNDPTKAGHTFIGWYNGDTEFDFNTPITGNITLKAKWTINSYTVTLNPNYPNGKTGTFKDKGGNTVNGSLVLTYDYNTASMSLTDLYQSIELEGYQFNGWYSATSGGSKWTSTGTITKDITVYAQWSKLYSITLSENGTPTTPTTQTSTSYTLPVELSAGSCQDDTKELIGWSTDAIPNPGDKPNSNFYELGETVTLTEDQTTFYAVFATPGSGGGGAPEETTTVAIGDQVVIIQIDDEKTELTGFRSDRECTNNNNYGTYAAYSTTPSATLVWTVEEGANDGTFAFKNGNYYLNLGGNDNYLSCSTTKNTSSSWTVTENNDRAVVTNVEHNSRKIMWNQSSPRFASYAKNHGLNSNQYYYHIKFYKLNGGTSYSDYTTTCDNTKATITYDLNGGTGATCGKTIVTKDVEFSLCDQTPTKEGYTFAGWSDGTKTYAEGSQTTVSESTTFYAAWTAKTITITWDQNYIDCPASETSTYIYDGEDIEMPEDPIRKGYKFTGWFTESSDGTQITEVGETNKPSSDVTYYAHWDEQYTVTYFASGQQYLKQEYKYTSGEKLVLPETDPSAANFACDGYLFEGWSKYQQTKEDANCPELVDANTLVENDLELHAVWKKTSASGGATTIFYESFDTENGKGANDDDWSNSVGANDLVNETWTFENGYGAYQCVKLGASKNKGSATTPTLTQLSGEATLSFKAAAWVNNNETTTLNLSISGGGKINGQDKVSVGMTKGAWTTYEVTITDGTPSSTITFAAANASNNRFFLDEVTITTSGSYNYTTSPNCGPTMVAKENVWVTSANGQSVKVNVPLGIKLFEGAATIIGTSTNENFVVNTLENAGNGEHNLVVVYTPTADDTKENTTITLTAKVGEETISTTTFTLNGRSLPDQFAIVVDKASEYYALPANMPSEGTYTGFGVEVNAGTVIAAPKTHLYTARAVHSTRFAENGTALRLVGNNDACLWASTAKDGTSIRNYANISNATDSQYEWNLYTEDGETYRISCTAVTEEGRILRMYGQKFGMYKSGNDAFRILPVECTSTPLNVSVSAARTSATISWTNADACNVEVYNGSTKEQTISAAASPVVVSNLAESTAYTFTLTPADNESCVASGAFTTTGPTIDIVEWETNGIVIQVDKDNDLNPKVIIKGEEEHGNVGGNVADELFFSKYFESHGENKLLAIFNGTTTTIDLTGYTIKSENGTLDLSQFGQTKGKVASNEEIILVYYDANYSAEECAEEQQGYENWNILTEKGVLAFSGRGSLGLYKNDVLIDVIGSTFPSGELTKIGKSDQGCGTGDDVRLHIGGKSVNDQSSFFCYNGDNHKTTEVETDYPISTNRCLLIRKNTVTSGANAVASNKAKADATCGDLSSTFTTLCSEWSGFRIGSGSSSNAEIQNATCDGLGYVGGFDYNNYYRTLETLDNSKTLNDCTRNADENTYFIEIEDLAQYSCLNIQLQLTDGGGNVLTEQTSQVPILVAGEKSTTDEIFSAIVKDSETSEPDYETSKIRCSTCDVVILKNATLTKAALDTENDVNQVRDIYIYPGGKLVVPANATDYSVNNISLRRVQDEVAAADIQASLNITSSSKAPIFVDVRIDANNWHWFALPYDCNIADVTWADGSKAAYNTDWFLMYYDGESRAASTNPYDNHWKVYEGTKIEAGKGYIVGITGNVSKPAVKFELRFPMAQEVLADEKDDKEVAVNAWGVQSDNTPNNLGWNLVGNPYLNHYKTADEEEYSPLAGLPLIHYTYTDPVTGEWNYENSGSVPYVATPIDGGWYEYRQELASEVNMMPFTAYFVQVGDPNTHENGQDLYASFEASNRGKKSIVRRAPREVEEIEEPIIVRVELTNSKGESDKTSLVIDQRFTNEYEMNGDFFKWFGDYYNYYTKPVLYTIGADQGKRAFNALNEELAKQPIPMGMYAAQAGNYTFSLNQQFDLSRVEEVWLYDATQSTYTNLMQSDYTFSTSKVNGAGRFSLSVKLAPKVATSIDNVTADKVWATTHTRQVIVNGLENGMHLWLYDATGKLLYTELTNNYQHTYSVPQTGTYFVSVMKGNAKQTIKVVVE